MLVQRCIITCGYTLCLFFFFLNTPPPPNTSPFPHPAPLPLRDRNLLPGAVPLAALLPVHPRELRASAPADRRVVLEPLACDPHRRLPARVPRHLLLLPQIGRAHV